MKVLGLETSGRCGSVAALAADALIGGQALPSGHGSARSLAPAIEQVLREAGWAAREIELIAVACGPGSFTGLRVGITTAKTLAYATDTPVVAINTLDVIARQAGMSENPVFSTMNAYRQQLFSATYHCEVAGRMSCLRPVEIVDIPAWLSMLPADCTVTGPGLSCVQESLPATTRVVDASCRFPRAETVGRLGFECYQAGQRDDLWTLVPRYYRQSAAEEKLPLHRSK